MRLVPKNIRIFTLWLAFVFTGVSPLAILAQDATIPLPAKFKLVENISEITEDGVYLVGAEYSVPSNNQMNVGFCLLTNINGSSTLKGVESTYPVPKYLEVSDDNVIWKFHKSGISYSLYSPAVGKNVALKKKSKTSLTMSFSEKENWLVKDMGDGTFMLQSTTDSQRALGINWYQSDKIYFGLYKTHYPVHVRLFKELKGNLETAVKPADGSQVALVSDNRLMTVKEGKPVPIDVIPFVLEDHTLAYASQACSWTCHHVNDDFFCLEDAEGKGLETIVDGLPKHMEWQICDGYLVTTETAPRYLIQHENGEIVLSSKFQSGDQMPIAACLVPMGVAPSSVSDDKGVRKLSGTWSVPALSSISWKNINVLDLTDIKIPLSEVVFLQRPKKSNAVICVSSKSVFSQQPKWKNVVARGLEGNYVWCRPDTLSDREPWFIDRDIYIGKGSLTYSREAYGDGHWETICLPFSAQVPVDFEVSQFEGRTANGNLLFKKGTTIVADQPMLLRYTGDAQVDKVSFVVTSEAGTVRQPMDTQRDFSGTYLPINVTKPDTDIYMLNASGETFVRVAEGSRLAPFRAFFYAEEDYSLLRVIHAEDELTGMSSMSETIDFYGKPCYTPQGRIVSPALTVGEYKKLPHGVYIIEGKKHLK